MPFRGLAASLGSMLGVFWYCLSDLQPLNKAVAARLVGLPLLLCADGSLTTFGRKGKPTVVAHNKSAKMLLPDHWNLFMHPAAARLTGWRSLPGPVQKVLGIVVFRIHVIANYLDKVLPNEWHKKPMVPWNGTPTPRWLMAFYSLMSSEVASLSDGKADEIIHAFDNWPIIPARTTVSVLLAPTRLNQAIRLLSTKVADLNSRHKKVLNLLARCDVAVLSSAVPIPQELSVQEFSPRGVLKVLAASEHIDWKKCSAANRDLLLTFWEMGESLRDEDLDRLRRLPLFEIESPPGQPATFMSLEDTEAPRELPAGIAHGQLNGTFLRSKALVCPGLYEQLGIKPLPRDEYYTDYIFPKLETMTQAGRLKHMDDVRRNWSILSTMNPEFKESAGSLNISLSTHLILFHSSHKIY